MEFMISTFPLRERFSPSTWSLPVPESDGHTMPAKSTSPKVLPQLTLKTQTAWHTWLAKHHATAPGIWLQIAKKDSGIGTVTQAEAVEAALCWGWIDGQA